MSSATEHWQTPDEVLDLVREMGPIILDPCASQDERDWFAEDNYNGTQRDGLDTPWKFGNGRSGIVYVNPPYGRHVSAWTSCAVVEARTCAEIIILTPARTDTKWFHGDLLCADAWCLWRGRMRFSLPGQEARNSATFPSLLTYFGPHRRLFYETFRHRGRVIL